MRGQVLKFDDTAHRAADEALPWYVNGTLEGPERAAIERHLRECARCRREVELLQQLHAACRDDSTERDATPSFRKLKARIGLGREPGVPGSRWSSLRHSWQRVPAWAQWAIAVQFAAIVGLAVVMAAFDDEAGATYRTFGSGDVRPSRSAGVVVRFAPATPEAELRRVLRAVGARVVGGPTAAGAYVLEVPSGQRAAALAALRGEPSVSLAEPLTVQPEP
jgi:anti-sigma factor RsiW